MLTDGSQNHRRRSRSQNHRRVASPCTIQQQHHPHRQYRHHPSLKHNQLILISLLGFSFGVVVGSNGSEGGGAALGGAQGSAAEYYARDPRGRGRTSAAVTTQQTTRATTLKPQTTKNIPSLAPSAPSAPPQQWASATTECMDTAPATVCSIVEPVECVGDGWAVHVSQRQVGLIFPVTDRNENHLFPLPFAFFMPAFAPPVSEGNAIPFI